MVAVIKLPGVSLVGLPILVRASFGSTTNFPFMLGEIGRDIWVVSFNTFATTIKFSSFFNFGLLNLVVVSHPAREPSVLSEEVSAEATGIILILSLLEALLSPPFEFCFFN